MSAAILRRTLDSRADCGRTFLLCAMGHPLSTRGGKAELRAAQRTTYSVPRMYPTSAIAPDSPFGSSPQEGKGTTFFFTLPGAPEA